MRIVMAANWWYRRGGLGDVALAEADALVSRGHAVIPFAAAHPDNVPALSSRYFPPFIETSTAGQDMGLFGKVTAAATLVYRPQAARLFGQLLDEYRPDIVHLHGPARQLTPAVVGAARRRHIPVVMTLHDYLLVCPQGMLVRRGTACRPPNCLSGNVLAAIEGRCVKGSLPASALAATETLIHRSLGLYTGNVELLVAPSRFLARLVASAAGVPGDRVRVLPNGLPDEPTDSALPAVDGRHVLFAGRLVREKGVHVLLDAARQIPEIPIVIAGDGPERASLMNDAPPNARFVGLLGRNELGAVRSQAVAVVSPSVWDENAPLSVLEALRAGRPVIATNLGGHPELVTADCGLLVEPSDSTGLAEAIARLWHDRATTDRLGLAARRRYLDRYGLDLHVDRLLDLYGQALRSASRPVRAGSRLSR